MTGRGIFCAFQLACLLSALADGRNEWCGVRYLEPTQAASSERASAGMEPFDWSNGEAETNRIDLLLAFDTSAVTWLKGDGWASAKAFAEAAVDEMNAGLANTGLDACFKFRLAGVSQLGVNLSSSPIDKLLDGIEDREKPSASQQRKFAELRSLRDEVSADVVAVLVDSPYELRGYSTPFLPKHFSAGNIEEIARYAYCVCSIGAVRTHYSLLHEVGHVMGAGHCDTQTLSPGPQLFPYSAGYQFSVGSVTYTTVMGYPSRSVRDPVTRLPFFSSPEFEMDGVSVGTADRNDNTRTLRETFGYVANFRVAKPLPGWGEARGDKVAFLVGNSDHDRLEAVAGGGTERVFVPLKGLAKPGIGGFRIVAKFPRGGGEVSSSDQEVVIPQGIAFQPGDEVTLQLLKDGQIADTGSITFVEEPENGPTNPYWLGEKPELEAGDWSMDLDAVTNAVKAGRADYAVVFFTGALWCPHCQGIEDFVFMTDAGRRWARENRVVFAVMDNPRRSPDANPTLPNGAPPTLLRYESGSNSYNPGADYSGAAYLSRKGLPAGEVTEAVLQRNHTLGYPGGYFCAPEATRTGYPTFILLDNVNFKPVARFVRSEEDRSASPGDLKGNYKYYHDLDDHLQRLDDFLKLRDGDGELDSYVSTTPLAYSVGETRTVEVQLNDRYRAFTLNGLSESGALTLRATNGKGRPVALEYYVDGQLAGSATDELVVKVKRGDLGKRLVVRVNGYPDTAVKLGGTSVYDIALSSAFEPSQINDSATLPLRFAADVCLEELDLEGVKSVKVSKNGLLPSGLSIKYDKDTGSIVLKGKPTRAKTATVTYTYTLTYEDGHRETSEPVEVSVEAYDPAEGNPYLGEKLSRTIPLVAGGRLAGLLTVSATTSARITAKFTGDEKVSFSGYWETLDADATAHAALTKKDATLMLTLDADGKLTARLSNVDGFATLKGDSMPLVDAEAFAGKYSVALVNTNETGVNFGHGSLQLTMTSASKIKTGTMSYSGVLPDGSTVSGTSQLCADERLEYEDGATYACAVLPIYKRTSKYEAAFLLRIRAGGGETYRDETSTRSHVVFASEQGGCFWNGLALEPFGSWFKDGIALSGWQDVYEHVSTNFVLKLDGEKVAAVTASGTKVKLTDKPQGATVSMSYTKSTGSLSGSIRLKLGDGSKLSGSWKGALLPGWHYSCGGCGDDDGVVLPFGMGTFYYTVRTNGKSVKTSFPVTLEILDEEK